jgi:hypothetical protein
MRGKQASSDECHHRYLITTGITMSLSRRFPSQISIRNTGIVTDNNDMNSNEYIQSYTAMYRRFPEMHDLKENN